MRVGLLLQRVHLRSHRIHLGPHRLALLGRHLGHAAAHGRPERRAAVGGFLHGRVELGVVGRDLAALVGGQADGLRQRIHREPVIRRRLELAASHPATLRAQDSSRRYSQEQREYAAVHGESLRWKRVR